MQEFLDKDIFLSEARMLWEDYRTAYMLVEGKSDKIFYQMLFGEIPHVQLRIMGGWEGIHEVVSFSETKNFPYILGVIDRDYHELLEDSVIPTQQLIFTDAKDLEMILFNSSSFMKFLNICGVEEKLKTISDKRGCIIKAAAPTGILRYLSLRNKDCIVFDGFEHKEVVAKKDLSVDNEKLVKKLIDRSVSKGKKIISSQEALLKEMNRLLQMDDKVQYCNGHDVMDVICVAMTKMYASCDAKDYDAESVFNYLLMGYTFDEFSKTQIYSSLQSWFAVLEC